MLLTCILVMVCAWFWQRQNHNAGYVDVIWSFLLGFQACYYLLLQPSYSLFLILGLGLAIIWSMRLSIHLLRRVAHESEDGRYAALRIHWAENAQRNFFVFYLAQGLLAWGFGSVFFQLANAISGISLGDNDSLLYAQFGAGFLLGVVAIFLEGLADQQLAHHRAKQPGITCRSGLWRYSRHPNYFFEWLHWWAYPLMALSLGVHGKTVWVVWLAPLLMLVFLYRLTGIPYTEKQALKSRGDDYRRYMKETSAFIPWFPKHPN